MPDAENVIVSDYTPDIEGKFVAPFYSLHPIIGHTPFDYPRHSSGLAGAYGVAPRWLVREPKSEIYGDHSRQNGGFDLKSDVAGGGVSSVLQNRVRGEVVVRVLPLGVTNQDRKKRAHLHSPECLLLIDAFFNLSGVFNGYGSQLSHSRSAGFGVSQGFSSLFALLQGTSGGGRSILDRKSYGFVGLLKSAKNQNDTDERKESGNAANAYPPPCSIVGLFSPRCDTHLALKVAVVLAWGLLTALGLLIGVGRLLESKRFGATLIVLSVAVFFGTLAFTAPNH